MTRLTTDLESKTLAVNKTLDEYFSHQIDEAASISDSYRKLWIALHTLIQAGGKRVRPQLTLLAYEAFGGLNSEKIIPIAAAQELLHFSLLIHDDIIDRDYIRYGVPNVSGQYQDYYQSFVKNKTELTHYANSAALLGGDLMLSSAYKLITSSSVSDKDKITAQSLLNQSIFEVAAGELLDTEAAFMPLRSGDTIKIARYKTASYSFIVPLLTGAHLGGASEKQLGLLQSFASSLGIAYQLVDDLLGVFGDEKVTGKSTSSDLTEGKHTYMIEFCLENLTPSKREVFDAAFGKPDASPAMIMQLKDIIASSGARDHTEKAILEYAHTARTALQSLNLTPTDTSSFEQFIIKVTDRSY